MCCITAGRVTLNSGNTRGSFVNYAPHCGAVLWYIYIFLYQEKEWTRLARRGEFWQFFINFIFSKIDFSLSFESRTTPAHSCLIVRPEAVAGSNLTDVKLPINPAMLSIIKLQWSLEMSGDAGIATRLNSNDPGGKVSSVGVRNISCTSQVASCRGLKLQSKWRASPPSSSSPLLRLSVCVSVDFPLSVFV